MVEILDCCRCHVHEMTSRDNHSGVGLTLEFVRVCSIYVRLLEKLHMLFMAEP